MIAEHWAVDDDELNNPSTIDVLTPAANLQSGLCEINYNSGEVGSQAFSVNCIQDALEDYSELTDSLEHVVVKLIRSYNYTEERDEIIMVLTDESDSNAGIVVVPRKEEGISFTEDYTTLSEQASNHRN